MTSVVVQAAVILWVLVTVALTDRICYYTDAICYTFTDNGNSVNISISSSLNGFVLRIDSFMNSLLLIDSWIGIGLNAGRYMDGADFMVVHVISNPFLNLT
jgi:hypothetical protein